MTNETLLLLLVFMFCVWLQFPQSFLCAAVPHYNLSIVRSCRHQKPKRGNFSEAFLQIAHFFMVVLYPISFISPGVHLVSSQKKGNITLQNKNKQSTQKSTFCQRTHFYFLHVAESCKQTTKNTLNKIKLHICPQPPSVPPVNPHQSPRERECFSNNSHISENVCVSA